MTSPDETVRAIDYASINAFEDLDQRVSAGTVLFGSVFGVNENNIEWVPDDDPPTEQERLAWLWLINPSRADAILQHAREPLRSLVVAYRDGNMTTWWQRIASPDGQNT